MHFMVIWKGCKLKFCHIIWIMEFEILGGLPKSFISDFGLEGGKTPYKDDTRIQLIQVKGS